MSLTQERINEIKEELWNLKRWHVDGQEVVFKGDYEVLIDLFLSRLREKQEPYGYRIENHASIVFTRNKELAENGGGFPLFTIPPATPECDCKELVEALEKWKSADEYSKQYAHIPDANEEIATAWHDAEIARDEALAKHKASMGEKAVIDCKRNDGGADCIYTCSPSCNNAIVGEK